MVKIIHKRGKELSVPVADPSELIFTSDTGKMFYGTGNGNIEVAKKTDLENTGIVLLNHVNDKANPHGVTKSQVGLSNVNNTSDLDKPISKATQTALDNKASTAVATTSINGLISAADKTKLDGIATGANKYVHPSGDGNLHVPATSTTNSGKVLKAGATAGSISWGTLSKSDVGLGSVTNVAQASKTEFDTHVANTTAHITAAERTAWNNKAEKSYVDTKVSDLVNSAPETLDTLGELATAIQEADSALDGLITTVGTKASNADLTSHTGNTTVHITAAERTSWNGKASTAVATTSANGLMASADKTKLNGIATNANNYSHPTGDGNLHVPATSTTNNGKVLKAGSTAGSISWGTLAKADVGLGNVDNTSDINKPISTATQTALNAKAGTAVATTSANGLMAAADKTKLDGIATGANNYTLPVATTAVVGGVKQGTNVTIAADGTISSTNTTYSSMSAAEATTGTATSARVITAATLKSAVEKFSLPKSSVTLGASTDWNTVLTPGVYSFSSESGIGTNGPTGAYAYGTAVVLKSHNTTQAITQNYYAHSTGAIYTRTGYSDARWSEWTRMETTTGSQAKVDAHAANTTLHISAEERTKLSGIAAGANNYSLPTATASVLGGVKTGTNIANSSGTISVANASTTVKGVVQLTDALNSTSTSLALSANGAKSLNDRVLNVEGRTIKIPMGSTAVRYHKIGEMPGPSLIDSGQHYVTLMISGMGSFGSNSTGSVLVYLSNRGYVGGRAYVLNNNGITVNPIKYVVNGDKVDIYYVDVTTWEYATTIKVVGESSSVASTPNVFKLFSTSTTAPTGLTAYTGDLKKYATDDAVTTSANGLMTAADKTKLNGIATGANNYSLPTATASVLGGIKTGTNITNTSGVISVADATTSVKGVVQLSSAVNSTSTTLAATASAVKSAYDLANAANTRNKQNISDTRAVNDAPSVWYGKGMGVYQELKTGSTVGLSAHTYVVLETTVPWSDSSGGPVSQKATHGSIVYLRHSTSNTAWSAWVKLATTAYVDTLRTDVTEVLGG